MRRIFLLVGATALILAGLYAYALGEAVALAILAGKDAPEPLSPDNLGGLA